MPNTQLTTTQLGGTGLEISRVGFGAWALGGANYDWGWGTQDDEDSIAAIHHSLELGVNWIDTAAQYGFGHSEEVVGRALAGLADRPYVFTKGGQPEGPGRATVQSLKRDSLRRELEGSLSRLGVDAIDLYQIHWPIPDEEIEEGWSTLAELKEEGLVRHIGVSNFDVEQLQRVRSIAPVETLQPPYSLVDRDVEDAILPFAEREGIGVIVYSPMGSGLLTGAMTRGRIASLPEDDWRKRSERFQEPQLSTHLALVERLETIAGRLETTPGAVAVAWTLRNSAVDGAIVGFHRPDRSTRSSRRRTSSWARTMSQPSKQECEGAHEEKLVRVPRRRARAAHRPAAGCGPERGVRLMLRAAVEKPPSRFAAESEPKRESGVRHRLDLWEAAFPAIMMAVRLGVPDAAKSSLLHIPRVCPAGHALARERFLGQRRAET